MAERASDDRWVVWLVAALGAVVVGLFVGLAGVTALLLVAFWGCVLGAVIVIPALVNWRAKDSIDSGTPAGQVQLQLLRYAWPLGIAVWLAGRARRLPLGSVATGLLDMLRTLLRLVRRGGQRQP